MVCWPLFFLLPEDIVDVLPGAAPSLDWGFLLEQILEPYLKLQPSSNLPDPVTHQVNEAVVYRLGSNDGYDIKVEQLQAKETKLSTNCCDRCHFTAVRTQLCCALPQRSLSLQVQPSVSYRSSERR